MFANSRFVPDQIRAGFTLVEVTLALAIVAFGCIAIFGLIPVGLGVARKAMEASTGSQIVQRVAAEVKQTDFQKLATFQMSFDDQATPVKIDSTQKIYDAQVTFSSVAVPGGNPAITNSNLVCAKIVVAINPGRIATPFDGSVPRRVYSTLVARSTGGYAPAAVLASNP